MVTSYIGASVKRKEDRRLLLGRGAYSEDIQIPGTLWVHLIRSPHAHARIVDIDATAALAHPGVVAVFTGRDLHPRYRTVPLVAMPGMPALDAFRGHRPLFYLMAVDKVRHMGEVVVMIVAQDRHTARDAEELVQVEYEALPAVGDPKEALAPDAPRVHDELPNQALLWSRVTANVAQAFEDAHIIVNEHFVNQRIHAVPMEPRAGVAYWNPKQEEVTVWASVQTPHDLRDQICHVMDLPEEKVRVIAPDVGGGFGAKAHGDPEYSLLAIASKEVGAPVKWVATRSEEFIGMNHARGKVSDVEVAADTTGRITAARVRHYADLGAYPKGPEANLALGSVMSCVGAYAIPEVDFQVQAVYTHRTPEAPYRGAGRPEGIFLIERAIDILARRLGMDPAEIRRRNYISPESLPYVTPGGDHYDSGNYGASLEHVLQLSNYSSLRQEQARLRDIGRYMGIGLSTWLKSGGIGPSGSDPTHSIFEWGRVRIDRQGKVTVYTGSSPHGQGHPTTFAQVAAEVLGVPLDDITVLYGDTSIVAYGNGTFASRSMATGGPAIYNAAHKVLGKMREVAAHAFTVSPDQVTYQDGVFSSQKDPRQRLSFVEVAQKAHRVQQRPQGTEYGLDEDSFFQPTGVTYSYGTYAAVVEVDVETGDVEVQKLFCVDDQGVVVNPMIVEAQIHGGATQGLGQALYEQIRYDDRQQLTNGSLMDYGLPTAEMVPAFVNYRMESPTYLNPLGVKGMGEGPTVGTPPAIVNAVVDALAPLGVTHIEMPLTPDRVRKAIEEASTTRGG